MPIGWSGSGIFNNSLSTDKPFAPINRSSVLGTIPAASYGPGARLVIICCARTGSAADETESLVTTLSGGAFTNYTPSGAPDSWFDDGAGGPSYYLFARVIEPSGWSFDAGTSISITSQTTTSYRLAGTVSGTSGSPNLVGSGTAFTTQVSVGQRLWSGSFLGQVLSITDDSHLTLNANLSATLSGRSIDVADTEAGAWVAALVTFDPLLAAPPDGSGEDSTSTTSGVLAPLYANGPAGSPGPWSVHSVSGSFGGYGANGIRSMDQYLTNPSVGDLNCNDALGMLYGYGTDGAPPYTPNLVSGNANWSAIGSVGSTPSSLVSNGVYAAMAHWTRPTPYDTSFSWSSFPATEFGMGYVEIFPRSPTPITGRSYGVIVG